MTPPLLPMQPAPFIIASQSSPLLLLPHPSFLPLSQAIKTTGRILRYLQAVYHPQPPQLQRLRSKLLLRLRATPLPMYQAIKAMHNLVQYVRDNHVPLPLSLNLLVDRLLDQIHLALLPLLPFHWSEILRFQIWAQKKTRENRYAPPSLLFPFNSSLNLSKIKINWAKKCFSTWCAAQRQGHDILRLDGVVLANLLATFISTTKYVPFHCSTFFIYFIL